MMDKVTVAAVQMNPRIGDIKINLERIISETRKSAECGARLVVFPECALTGYVFSSRKEALPFMETVPGPSTNRLAEDCRKLGVYAVMGMLERDGDKCYNAAVLAGPEGIIGKYRKAHLPYLGIDRFLDRGDSPFQVHKTQVGNIGLFICYDCNFPESARVMALQGAEILVLPTNWPEGRARVPRYVIVTRAFENRVNLIACDRVGSERGVSFIGTSKIISASGDVLAQASTDQEETITAEVSLVEAREKRIIFKPGEFELDFIHDRRPELYEEITKPMRRQ